MKRSMPILGLLLLLPACLAAAPHERHPALPGHPINVGLASGVGPWVGGHLVAFGAGEQASARDLNGDGDLDDKILFLYDAKTRRLTNIGLGFPGGPVPVVGEEFVAFRVYEEEYGEDVDGDGHLYSKIVQVFDARTGTTANLRQITGYPLLTVGRTLAFRADRSPHTMVYDVDTGVLRDLGLPGSWPAIVGDRVVFTAYESWAGEDLNGDGDQDDGILQVYDPATGVLENTGVTMGVVASDGDWAASWRSEAEDGVDRNGDGDAQDQVAFLYNVVDGRTLFAGLAVNPNYQFPHGPIKFRGGRLWVAVSEARQGHRDLNGDGDAEDDVLFGYDLDTETAVDTGAAVPFGYDARGDLAAFHGEIDGLSNLFVYDLARRRLRTLGFSAGVYVVGNDYVCFQRSELLLGGDLNGDGDLGDQVVHVYDRAHDRVINLGLAEFGWFLEGDWIDIRVHEFAQGADLDGDGILESVVNVLYDVPSRRFLNTAMPGVGLRALSSEIFAFEADEKRLGRDLDGDGDAYDSVLQVVKLKPASRGPQRPGRGYH